MGIGALRLHPSSKLVEIQDIIDAAKMDALVAMEMCGTKS